MKMKMKRFLALILVVALCASMLVFSAPSASALIPALPAISTAMSVPEIIEFTRKLFQFGLSVDDLVAWATGFRFPEYGEVSFETLKENLDYYNNSHLSAYYNLPEHELDRVIEFVGRDLFPSDFGSIQFCEEIGYFAIFDKIANAFVVDADGLYPYCTEEEYRRGMTIEVESGSGAVDVSISKDNKWRTELEFGSGCHRVTYDALSAAYMKLAEDNAGVGLRLDKVSIDGTLFWAIARTRPTDSVPEYYCSPSGYPFLAAIEPSVADTDRDHIDEEGNPVGDDDKLVDIVNGIVNIIQETGLQTTLQMDSLIFNFDDHSYTVNCYDVTYDVENNYYEYNYYTYNISYTYNNTYITYLGSNVGYEPEEWEFYYELPDGRSSADLTAADIAGLSFEFYDVVNYAKSAEDTSLRALYHFDGDTDDSSYFSTQSSFEWKTNASITYMDSGVFEGALYMDEQAHEFDLTLPSNIGSGDFTYQWRYYHNAAEVTTAHRDNYIYLGDTPVFSWAENYIYNANGELIGVCNNGSWQEFALIRNNGKMYYYHNGLCVGQLTDNRAYANQIRFVLGDTSRAYSMVDEMRFLNYAHAVAGSDYRCTTVPYDTNAVLVLPDGAFPIADEYWQFNTEGNRLVQYDFTTGEEFYPIGSTERVSTRYYESGVIDYTVGYYGKMTSPYTSVSYFDGHMTVTGERAFTGTQSYDGQLNPYYGLVTSLARSHANGYIEASNKGLIRAGDENKPFTFSVMDAQENLYSITFSVTFNANNDAKSVEFDWGYLQINTRSNNGIRYYVSIIPKQGKSIDIVYMELVEGETPNSGHELVKCIYSSEEVKPNTAAIQTDIPVAGYTVGGVRPTLPSRGDMWFPVESNRITGSYIYNGSAWEAVNARWYTGTRWIPIYAFDIVTLLDMWDIADADDVIPSINSEYGFWNWWKAQWLDFRAWLESVLGSGTVTTPGGTVDKEDLPSVPGTPNEDGEEEGGWSIIELLVLLKDGTWRIVTGVVTTGFESITGFAQGISSIGDYFDAYDINNPDGITGIYTYEGADIWD